jgi:crossover junction endodeoxyribonuclease RuvC
MPVVGKNTEAMGLFVGLDPGVTGGLACLEGSGSVLAAYPMPPTEAEILSVLQSWRLEAHTREVPISAVLEGVHAFPKQGVTSAFNFGLGYGGLLMALTAAGIPFEKVYPVRWQNALGCRTGGNKNITKDRAQALFPTYRVTHAIADALLLAEYGRLGAHGTLFKTGEP